MNNSAIDFLYLSESDMLAAGVSDMAKCIETMEEMFCLLHKGDYRMGGKGNSEHGIKVTFPNESDIEGMPLSKPDYRFMAMPAYLGGRFHSFGIKSYGSNPDNKELGLPRSILMMSLMDAATGAPQAYMSANVLSAMRTAAATGLGAKYFCKKDAKCLSIIGPGVMARYALDAFMTIQNSFETVKIKGRGKKNIDKFVEYVHEKYPTIKTCVICDSIEEACEDSDLIYFGTTNATKFEDNPHIEYKWIKPGAVVIGISALLVDVETLSQCRLVADDYKMYENWGLGYQYPTQKTVSTLLGMGFYDAVSSGKIKREDVVDIGDVIANNKQVRQSDEQIIMYAVGGIPVEDVAWGYECYQNALRKSIGTKLNLWEVPKLVK